MKTNHLDDQMNSILLAVIAGLALATAFGVGEGESFGRGEVMVSAETATALTARAPEAPVTARITVVGKRPVAVLAAAH